MALSSTANVTKFQLGAWWLAARPKTLAASVAPILVGGMAAWPVMNPMIFIVSLLCAISLQITVNFANDYFDAKSGIDTPARLGPVRATASGLIAQKQMRFAIELMLLLSACLGLLLIAHGGWLFLFLGAGALLVARRRMKN